MDTCVLLILIIKMYVILSIGGALVNAIIHHVIKQTLQLEGRHTLVTGRVLFHTE